MELSRVRYFMCFLLYILADGTPGVSADHVTLLFVGDISFSGPVKYYVQHNYHSYNACFTEVAPFIRDADISVANLESPFVNTDVYSHRFKGPKTVLLDSSPQSASALRFAGFNAVTVANNHMNDFGDAGANFTLRVLEKAGIKYFGMTYGPYSSSQVPLVVKARGVKIGFLGYCHFFKLGPRNNCSEMRRKFNSGPAIYREDIAERDIRTLKNKVDIIVVYIHWGMELFFKPLPYQLQVTDHLLSLGVHLIIGSHSHVVQQHSLYGNKLVKFGLGNFLFPPPRIPGGNDPIIYGRLGVKPNKERIDIYEKIALGDSETLKSSQLFRVKVSKSGVECADYLPVKLSFDQMKKRIHLKPTQGQQWIAVCGDEDLQCQGLRSLKQTA